MQTTKKTITGIIYKATAPSGRSYVGQTTMSLHRRITAHSTKSNCVAIKRAIDKYGDGIQWSVVHTVYGDTKEEVIDVLNGLEEYYIEYFETLSPVGYNLNTGGRNHTTSEETKRKMSIALKGRKHSEETKRNISTAMKGRKLTEEHKRKMSLYWKGRKRQPMTERQKKKLSAAHTGKKMSEEARKNMSIAQRCKLGKKNNFYGKKHTEESKKKISVAKKKYLAENPSHSQKKTKATNIYTGEVFIFESVRKAAEELSAMFGEKFWESNMSAVCRGVYRQHKGFTFEYIT